MYDTYIIETRMGAAGIVVRDGGEFRFFAATHAFSGLEGQTFATPKQAEIAAVRHLGPRKSSVAAKARRPAMREK
jgi:hypothetical protein